jgi:hypothetical protein
MFIFCSQFEEKFEEMPNVDTVPVETAMPAASVEPFGVAAGQTIPDSHVTSDLPEMLDNRDSFYSQLASHHQDIGGIMRILPSDVNVSNEQQASYLEHLQSIGSMRIDLSAPFFCRRMLIIGCFLMEVLE